MEKAHVGGGIHPRNGAQVAAVERLTLGKYKTRNFPTTRAQTLAGERTGSSHSQLSTPVTSM